MSSRTVRGAGEPDRGGSGSGHPGVRGQSRGVGRPLPRPRQGGPSRDHEVGGHEAGRHHAGRQAAGHRGGVHLGELRQLLGLSGGTTRRTPRQHPSRMDEKTHDRFVGAGVDGLLPEHFLLLALQPAGQ